MDDVFLSEVDLEGHEEWNVVGGSTVGTVSYMPTNSENEMDILAVQLDITSPLSTLKAILGHRLGADFSHCELWLQDLVQVWHKNIGFVYHIKIVFSYSSLMKQPYLNNASKEKDWFRST
jgi:hypothetical protein